jgi:hypothetical protein
MKGNNLRMMVGDEYFDNLSDNLDSDYEDFIPGIIDYTLTPPNLNFNFCSGYLYFNLTIETFGYGLWRGSELCTVSNYIMVFPSAFTMNDGKTYWGTDVQPNYGTMKNSYIGFFGSKQKDILAEWGFYDAQYIHFLRDMALEWMKLMNDYGESWNNHLLDNPTTINVARGMEYASNVMDALSSYGVGGLIQLGKNKIGDAYEYVKNNPEVLLYVGLSYAVEEATEAILAGVGLSAGLAFVGALLVGYTFPIDQLINDWNEWKKTHGTGWSSFAGFACNYIDPTNPDGLWHDWAKNCLDLANSIVDYLGLNPSGKSWEDWYNELSKYSYNSIIKEDFEEVAFMVRDCSYGVSSYDGWMMPKYHIYKAYGFQTPKYELRRLIFFGDDAIIQPIEFDVDRLFNRPYTDLLLIKNYDGEYSLLSELIESHGGTIYLCSPYPSYIQMGLFGIPKIKIE